MTLILYNANIYTCADDQPIASAIALEGSRILALGSDQEILAEFSGYARGKYASRMMNMKGKTIIPGLIDAHIHLSHYALGLQKVNCETSTREECLRRVAERAKDTPAGEWILGHGWNQNDWPGGFGSATDIDRLVPHHPVYLTAKSLHAGWANSLAMQLAGINSQTPDPTGGQLLRDKDGKPTGILLESAMSILEKAISEPTAEKTALAIQKVFPVLWSMGLTSVHDFDGSLCFEALQILHTRGVLKLRVVKGIPLEKLPAAVELGLHTGFGDEILRIGSIKAFADGALGPQTAAMFEPYAGTQASPRQADSRQDDRTRRGYLLLDSEELYEHGRTAVQHGLSLAVHAIGDRANHEVLDAFENLRKFELEMGYGTESSEPFLRHRIEHVQLLHPGDTHRLSQLKVVASMQPIHATSDMPMADRYWGERASLSYAWNTQFQKGAIVAFGSDAPVESPNPFWGLHAAVTRRRQDGSPGPEGWYPGERVSLQEALNGYTRGPAYAAGMETKLGKLAPGYLADLVVLEQNLFACDPDHLYEIRPQATMVGGEWVWGEIEG